MESSRKWLLLVEDQPDDVFFFQNAARKAGIQHRVEVAADGREAIDLLTRKVVTPGSADLPALVLLDLKLPYVSGLEVLTWIRDQPALRAAPVVIFSSSEQEEDVEAAYRLGACGYLTKPSQAAELPGVVRAIDEFWLRRNRMPGSTIRLQKPLLASTA